jgi:K+-sensing histidine kinase KdpD
MTSTANPIARVAGATLPILVAALLVPFRESLQGATLVLVLVVVVVGVATTGDRVAAAIAAIIAAASFDFFLTRPYTSMRITSAEDLETAVMLLIIGLLVGQLATWGARRRNEANRARDELHRLELVADRIAKDPGTLGLLDMVESEITEMLELETCRFSLSQPDVPELRADGSVDASLHALVDGEFALPPEGVVIRIENGGVSLGWLHLVPADRVGVPLETRKVAIALGQQLGTALARPTAAGAGPADR